MNFQYLFNVSYYDYLYDKTSGMTTEDVNNKLIQARFPDDFGKVVSPFQNDCYKKVELKTSYPGLLIGTGNPHDSGGDNNETNSAGVGVSQDSNRSNNEVKLGFTLDYVTGLPYIPGATVKGTIRSIFKTPSDGDNNEIKKEEYRSRLDYVRDTLSTICKIPPEDPRLTDDNLILLDKEIFGDADQGNGTDTFYDAFPISGYAQGYIFGFEYITPHIDKFSNPVPLKLLKVLPGVCYEFYFKTAGSIVIDVLTADKKCEFYKQLLMDFGIGAKTNVGYGTMVSGEEKHYCPDCGEEVKKSSKTGKWHKYCSKCVLKHPGDDNI
jgi:CRISPR-associated protein Cmr6